MDTPNTHRRGVRPLLTLRERQAEAEHRSERRKTLLGVAGLFLALGALFGYLVCTSGCGRLGPEPLTPSEECRYHDDSFIGWQAATVASSSLGAAVAGGGIVSEAVGGVEGATIVLSVSGAILGAAALVGSLLASHHAGRYGEECRMLPPPTPTPAVEPLPPPEEQDGGITQEMPLLPTPEPAVELPGTTGTGADGLEPGELP